VQTLNLAKRCTENNFNSNIDCFLGTGVISEIVSRINFDTGELDQRALDFQEALNLDIARIAGNDNLQYALANMDLDSLIRIVHLHFARSSDSYLSVRNIHINICLLILYRALTEGNGNINLDLFSLMPSDWQIILIRLVRPEERELALRIMTDDNARAAAFCRLTPEEQREIYSRLDIYTRTILNQWKNFSWIVLNKIASGLFIAESIAVTLLLASIILNIILTSPIPMAVFLTLNAFLLFAFVVSNFIYKELGTQSMFDAKLGNHDPVARTQAQMCLQRERLGLPAQASVLEDHDQVAQKSLDHDVLVLRYRTQETPKNSALNIFSHCTNGANLIVTLLFFVAMVFLFFVGLNVLPTVSIASVLLAVKDLVEDWWYRRDELGDVMEKFERNSGMTEKLSSGGDMTEKLSLEDGMPEELKSRGSMTEELNAKS